MALVGEAIISETNEKWAYKENFPRINLPYIQEHYLELKIIASKYFQKEFSEIDFEKNK